jgi:hypothetical protein
LNSSIHFFAQKRIAAYIKADHGAQDFNETCKAKKKNKKNKKKKKRRRRRRIAAYILI